MPYLLLFWWSFLAATVLPLGSEPAVVLLVRQGRSPAMVVTVATVGNFLGACTTYAIGRTTAHALQRRQPSRVATRAAAVITRYGGPALLLSWVPVVGDALVAAAGFAALPVRSFAAWTIVGKAVRYVLVAWAAWSW